MLRGKLLLDNALLARSRQLPLRMDPSCEIALNILGCSEAPLEPFKGSPIFALADRSPLFGFYRRNRIGESRSGDGHYFAVHVSDWELAPDETAQRLYVAHWP